LSLDEPARPLPRTAPCTAKPGRDRAVFCCWNLAAFLVSFPRIAWWSFCRRRAPIAPLRTARSDR